MNKLEEQFLKSFSLQKGIEPDVSKWSNPMLIEWLSIIPNLDYNAVMENGTLKDKEELIQLYKTQVIKQGKSLSIGLIEYEGITENELAIESDRRYMIQVI